MLWYNKSISIDLCTADKRVHLVRLHNVRRHQSGALCELIGNILVLSALFLGMYCLLLFCRFPELVIPRCILPIISNL